MNNHDAITPQVTDDIDGFARVNADAAADALKAVLAVFPDRFTSHREAILWREVDRDDLADLLELVAHLAEAIGETPARLFAEAISDHTDSVAAEVKEIEAAPARAATCPKCEAEVPEAARWFGPCKCQRPATFPLDAIGKAAQADQDATAVMHVYAALQSPGRPYQPFNTEDDGANHVADLHADLAHHAARHDHDPAELAERGRARFEEEHAEAEAQYAAEQGQARTE